MTIKVEKGKVEISRELSELDKFVLGVVNIIERYTNYVIVGGYVTIIFGRPRGTEDVDIIIERISENKFAEMCKAFLREGFEFLNPEDCRGLYEMLKDNMGIRLARKSEVIPNAEIKFPKDYLHEEALRKRIIVKLGNERLYISPIELQIAYKLYLGSDKDIEDAFFLYELFKDHIDRGALNEYAKKLGVEIPF
ncbi:hypothetical protein PNA2_1879 [Pyrococcus sp. NA2]|uniref:hypothetical protein n=1 Tax=Pyrococcus sp. (strain NA2) TaxID=342949 RepID=UPI000209ACEB|nr:hypothetical protein [Pyrococcus sp. NA2]AEC52793.1 hypothetical protein PNA2_1879 [Pyrococcus sp. NA2]